MSDQALKALALSVISAVEMKDLDKFDQAFKAVDEEVAKFLERFLVEVATGRPEVFKKEDAPQFYSNPNFARAILRAWKRVGSASGKLAARMSFEAVISTPRRR